MPTRPSSTPSTIIAIAFEYRSVRQHHRRDKTEQHDRDVVGGLKQQRDLGERRPGDGDQKRHDRSANSDAIAAIASAGPARPCCAIA